MRRISVENGVLEAMRTSQELVVRTKQHPPISFALPGAAAAIAALKSCGEDLLQSWGVDLARLRPAVPPGQPGHVDLTKFLTADDYPRSVEYAAGGTARALLSLAVDGKVKECRVVESSGQPALDTRTCEIALSRMRYPPIQDAAGQQVESWTFLTIHWAGTR